MSVSSSSRKGARPLRVARPAPLPPIAALPAQTGEYSIFGLARGGERELLRERRMSFALGLFAVATVVAVVYALERYFYRRLLHEPAPLSQLVPAELLFSYLWVLLTPLVMWMARRFPVWGSSRRPLGTTARNWIVQAVAALGFTVLHVAVLTGAMLLIARGREPFVPSALFNGNLASWSTIDPIVYCALLAVFHALVYYRVSQDRALRASQLEARLAQSQLQMLRMQLQPHFLFNTLHSISALMHRDVKRADSMIASLSDLLRMSLRTATTQEVELREEVEFLQRYLEIMRLRFGDRLVVNVEIDPDVLDARVPALVLQPLVENALRHGFGDGVRGGTIDVLVQREGHSVCCDVIDDGRGIAPGASREGVGIGNTRARLQQLYGDESSLEVVPGETGGVRVSLVIPYHPLERTAAD